MSFEHINSVLIADIGSVHTRLVLFDLVEGQYRLVASSRARTTAEPPIGSAVFGLEHAAENMSAQIGRQLLSPEPEHTFVIPETSGHGVDEFLATSSAGRPMKVFLVGLTPELSLMSGQRVLAGSYVRVVDTLSPDDLRSEEEQVNAILHDRPDLILIVGGTDDGASDILLDLVRRVQTALSLVVHGSLPSVLYAGNQALRQQVRRLLSPLTNVFFARNVRPSLHDEQLFPAQIELALVYDDFQSRSPGGFDEIGRQSQVGVVPTTQGYLSTVRYMGELPQKGVGPLYVDVGSANSVIVAGVRQQQHYRIRTDLGMGHHSVNALATVTPEQVARWLPFEIEHSALRDYVYNKQLRPMTIPAAREDLLIEQALAREIVRHLVQEARPAWDLGRGPLLPNFQPVIGAGAVLTEAQHPGISAMLLLDALQPTGVVELALDPHNMMSALGVIAYLKPLITVQALETGGMVRLGPAFCPLGQVRAGKDAMHVEVRLPNGQVFKEVVQGGDLWMAPVLPGITAEVRIRLRRGLSLGGKRRLRRRVTAGAAGIVFDARGRPLVMPRPQDRAEVYGRWQVAMTGYEAGPAGAGTAAAAPLAQATPHEEAPDAILS